MNSVAEIIGVFQLAAKEQSKVNGPPNNNHTLKFKEDLLNGTFQITFEDTDGGDPSGAILVNAKYKAANNSPRAPTKTKPSRRTTLPVAPRKKTGPRGHRTKPTSVPSSAACAPNSSPSSTRHGYAPSRTRSPSTRR